MKHKIPANYAPPKELRTGNLGVGTLNGEGTIQWSQTRKGEVTLGPEDQQFTLRDARLPFLAYALLDLHNKLNNPE